MTRFRSFATYWLPVLIWMAVIFSASADAGSFQRSSRIIGPIVLWLMPNISPENLDRIVFVGRKCAHLTEYGIFALLLWRAIRKPKLRDERPWEWRPALIAFAAAALYAMTDEFHQRFIPHRQGLFEDVLIDSCGAMVALLVLRVIGHKCKLWSK